VGLHHLAILAHQLPESPSQLIHGIDSRHLLDAPIARDGAKSFYKTSTIQKWIENLEAKA
jgi:hypothetical protein